MHFAVFFSSFIIFLTFLEFVVHQVQLPRKQDVCPFLGGTPFAYNVVADIRLLMGTAIDTNNANNVPIYLRTDHSCSEK